MLALTGLAVLIGTPPGLRAELLGEEEIVREALRANPEVLAAEAELQAQDASVWKATSDLLPRAEANFTRVRNEEEIAIDPGELGPPGFPRTVIQPLYSSIFTMEVRQPLFAGGSLYQARRIAGLQRTASRHDLDSAKSSVALRARQAYYDLIKAIGSRRIARETLEQLEENLRVVNRLFEIGAVPRSDVLRAEVTVAEGQQELQRVDEGVHLAEAAVNLVMNRELTSSVEVEEEVELPPFDLTLEAAKEQAFQHRPELSSLRQRAQAADRASWAAAGSILPSVSLLYHYERNYHPGFFSGGEDFWWLAGVVRFELPIGLGNVAEVQRARAAARSVRRGLEASESGVLLEVEAAYSALQVARKGLEFAERRLSLAVETYRQEQVRYGAGEATQVDLLDAQTRLTAAKVNDLHTRIDFRLALARLLQAMGQGF